MPWFNESYAIDRAFLVFALDVTIKTTLIAFAVLGLLLILRTRSSTLGHRCYSFILLSMLLMPALTLLAPKIKFPLPTQFSLASNIVENQAGSVQGPSALVGTPAATLVGQSTETPIPQLSEIQPDNDAAQTQIANQPDTTEIASSAVADALSPEVYVSSSSFGIPLLLCVYATASGFMLLRLAIGLVQCQTLVRRSKPIHPFANNKSLMPSMFESTELAVPITVGLWRPRIILPIDWRHWDEAEVEMATTHESEHIRRRDTWISLLASINCALYWFHPLSWFVARRISTLAEHVCDDAVIATTGNRTAYAKTLISLAARLTASASRYRPAAIGIARRLGLEERVMRIIDTNRPLSTRVSWFATSVLAILIFAIATLAAGVVFTNGKAIADDAAKAQGTDKAETTESPPANTDDANKPTISGRVLSENGEPVSGAQVWLWTRTPDDKNKQRSVQSNVNGEFVFDDLLEGKHRIIAYSDGSASRDRRFKGLVVQSNDHDVVLRLQKSPSLRVRVTDQQSGKPISRALVRITWTDTQRDYSTDDEGRVTLQGLTSELWTIEVQAKGYAENVHAISLSSDTTDFDSALAPGFELYGTVSDSSGAPLPGVGVAIFPPAMRGEQIEYMVTDETGAYRFPYLPMSGVTLFTVLEGYGRFDRSITPLVSAGGQQRFDITLSDAPDGGSVTGTIQDVDGKPITGATIGNCGNHSKLTRMTSSDANGQFRLDDVLEFHGGYSLLIRAKGYAPQLVSFIPGAKDNPSELSVTLETGHAIHGRVVSVDGKPIEGVDVFANDYSSVFVNPRERVKTDSDGRFALDSLLAEESIDFTAPGYSTLQNAKLPLDQAEPVLVILKEQGRIRGKVIDDATGQPIPSFKVQMTFSHQRKPGEPYASISGPAAIGSGEQFVNNDGAFELSDLVQDMSLQVSVSADGYQRLVNPRIVVDSGKTTMEFRMKRITATTTIAGQIVDKDSKPVQGIQVLLVVFNNTEQGRRYPSPLHWSTIHSHNLDRESYVGGLQSASTGADGRFKFENVEQGKQIRLAYWGDGITQDQMLDVDKISSEAQRNLVIKTVAPGIVSGKIDRTELPAVINIVVTPKGGMGDSYYAKIAADATEYEIRNVPPGECLLNLGTRTQEDANGVGRSKVLQQVPIEVKSGETITVDLPQK